MLPYPSCTIFLPICGNSEYTAALSKTRGFAISQPGRSLLLSYSIEREKNNDSNLRVPHRLYA